jgi:hypothetical protein
MDALSMLLRGAGLEVAVAILALLVLDGVFVSWLVGRSRRRPGGHLVQDAERLASRGLPRHYAVRLR